MQKSSIRFFFLMILGILQCTGQSGYASSQFSTDNWVVAHHGEKTLQDLHFNGYITLDGTTISNVADINGYMHARFSNLAKLFVKGHTKIQDSNVTDVAHIEGELLAINVQFRKKLFCKSEKIILSHCRLPDLEIKRTDEPCEQIVVLEEGTEIFGSIVFESRRGRVIMSEDSTVKRIRGGIVDVSKSVIDGGVR